MRTVTYNDELAPGVAGRRLEKKQASLCCDNVAGGRGWHSREIKQRI
jgi:hypothetical protein